MGDAGGPGRQRVRHRRHAPVVRPARFADVGGAGGTGPIRPVSVGPAFGQPGSRPSHRRGPLLGAAMDCACGHRPRRHVFVRAATDAHVHETCVRSPSAPPRSVPLSPGRLAAGCQRGSAHAGEDAPSPGGVWLAGPDTPSPAEECLPGRSGHPIPRRRGACLDRPAQQLSVGPGRSPLITCRTCRKVSKLRGESLPCRQPWTATCPIGSVLLPSSRPLAGAPRTGDIFCPLG